jgi:RecA/RadA recombinase
MAGKSIKDGIDFLVAQAEKDAKRCKKPQAKIYRASSIPDRWRYVDFWDLGGSRPCLPLEWFYGTRGLLTGRVVRYDALEAAGKSSFIYMNYGMAQLKGGVWAVHYESEKTPPPPDFLWHLGCDPEQLLIEHPATCNECLEHLEKLVRRIRTDEVDANKNHPILAGIDSISGLGAKDPEDEDYEPGKGAKGLHARTFSDWFRERLDLLERYDVIMMASAQVKSNIQMGQGIPGLSSGGDQKDTTLADRPFKFHASWIATMEHGKNIVDGVDMGETITCKMYKNKLAPRGRMMKIHLRSHDASHPPGKSGWDFVQANKDLFFGPKTPFADGTYSNHGGWYKHAELNNGKAMQNADEFFNLLYANEDLLMRCREKLRIRGFKFKFETDYRNPYNEVGELAKEVADAEDSGVDSQ